MMPSFKFDMRAGRFRGPRGQFVTFQAVRDALDAVLDRSTDSVLSSSQSLRDGTISLAEWQANMARVVKDVHLVSASLAKGGWGQMTQSDYGRVGGMVVKQYRYLQRFAEQIEAGLPLDGRFVRRAKMYAESGRSTYHAALRAEMIVRRKSEERSRLAPADHCPECVDEHNKGWGRIGHIKLIGTRECRSNCKCFAEYR